MAKTIQIDEGPELPDWRGVIERRAGVVSVREFDGSDPRELIDHLKAELTESRHNERELREQLVDAFAKLAALQTALPEFKFDFPELPTPKVEFHDGAFSPQVHAPIHLDAPIDARTTIADGAFKPETTVNLPPIPAPNVTVELHDAPDSDS